MYSQHLFTDNFSHDNINLNSQFAHVNLFSRLRMDPKKTGFKPSFLIQFRAKQINININNMGGPKVFTATFI